MTTTRYLDRPDGRLAYEETGDPGGALVVCSPGVGDLRSTFSELASSLGKAGARVVTVDLRGHGESSVGWPSYRPSDIAADLLALVRALGGPAVLVGNSYSGSAAVLAAARAPELVRGLVLCGAFVRDLPRGVGQRLSIAALRLPGVGRRLWSSVAWPSFFGVRPADFPDRQAALRANLAERGRFAAVLAMTAPGGHAGTDAALAEVRCPALVVMGTADPDFADPAAEAARTADRLGGPARVLLVDGAGHYPQVEKPAMVGPAVVGFVTETACPARD